jgi:hypothetical protein
MAGWQLGAPDDALVWREILEVTDGDLVEPAFYRRAQIQSGERRSGTWVKVDGTRLEWSPTHWRRRVSSVNQSAFVLD